MEKNVEIIISRLAVPYLLGSLPSPPFPTTPLFSLHMVTAVPPGPTICIVSKDHCGSAPKECASALTWTNQNPFPEDWGILVMGMG